MFIYIVNKDNGTTATVQEASFIGKHHIKDNSRAPWRVGKQVFFHSQKAGERTPWALFFHRKCVKQRTEKRGILKLMH